MLREPPLPETMKEAMQSPPILISNMGDDNSYILGDIAGHWVVATCLAPNEDGASEAALTATHMKSGYPLIRFCLFVGTARGVDSQENDIRLGDVVVGLSTRPWRSDPEDTIPGVLQYELGEEGGDNRFQPKASMPQPVALKSAIAVLESDPEPSATKLDKYLQAITDRLPGYKHPCQDWLRGSVHHTPQRTTATPKIHYGLIASGDRFIEDVTFRNQIAQKYDILCFDMEAAGVINIVGCLVIRGICDYSDAQNNDIWRDYAAATAAAYAKFLLSNVACWEREGELD
ncbi:nucleoside phosphorylase [Trichoderma arundinaceum]|uniref:Nucleoside phosphorylase n=1 Tax=Trichoderma arundinaceum TaxID=490622 RepID=A0A395NBK7_TRIAR|nr:nucleoside phosphorylase [Trichoderma arundinaceum]